MVNDDSLIISAGVRPSKINLLLVCAFIDMLCVGVAVPVLPLLVGKFVATREEQAIWFGILTTVFGLMQFLFNPVLGALSDRVGRRPVLMVSMAGMSLNFLSTALAPNFALLFVGRVVGGMSAASVSVMAAYASDVSTHERRAGNYGKVSAALGLGFVCGPILGGFLGSLDLHLPFLVAAGLAALNMVYSYLLLPESLEPARRKPLVLARANPLAPLVRILRRPDLRSLVHVWSLVTFATLTAQTTWVLYTYFRFGWTSMENGVALFCVGVFAAVVQAGMLGWLLGAFGEVRLTMLGLLPGASAYLLFGLATQGWMMFAIIPVYVLSFVVAPTVQGAISRACPEHEQGEVMGALQSIGSLGLAFMPLLGSALLWQASDLPPDNLRVGTSFFLCSAILLVAAVLARRHFRAARLPT